MDGFQEVKKKHRIKTKSKLASPNVTDYLDTSDIPFEMARKHIEECVFEINQSDFWKSCVHLLKHSLSCEIIDCTKDANEIGKRKSATEDVQILHKEIVSYGIGHFASNYIARYQFAFVLLLGRLFKINCDLYDPVLTDTERMLLKEYNIKIIKENEECKRKVECKTIFVMFHCSKPMYNNLLWSNWGTNLQYVCIIGNSFSNYYDRIPSSVLSSSASYLHMIQSYTCEHPLENSFYVTNVFNDSSVHTFPPDSLVASPLNFWLDQPEPVVPSSEAEMIFKNENDVVN